MSEELKPCPFCGGNPSTRMHTEYSYNPFDTSEYVYEVAECCGVSVDIDTWNTRQTPEGYAMLSINDILSLTFSFDSRHRLEAMIAAAQEDSE